MNFRFFILRSWILLVLVLACPGIVIPSNQGTSARQTSAVTQEYPSLTAQAKELTDAFMRKDFLTYLNLTHPKVVNMFGGRDQYIASEKNIVRLNEAAGISFVAYTSGEPTQVIRVARRIYAVLPTTMKMAMPQGVFQIQTCMIGVSADGGNNWTFIAVGPTERRRLKVLLPDAAGRLELCDQMKPVRVADS